MLSLVQTIKVVAKKEIRESLKTKRLVIIGLLYLVGMLLTAIFHGHFLNSELVGMVKSMDFILVIWSGGSLFTILLAYDAIVGERRQKTLILLLSQPIEKDGIFYGKFVSRLVAIAIVFFPVVSLGMIVQVALSGNVPALGDVGRVYLSLLAMFFGFTCWLALTFLFSSFLKTPFACLVVVLVLFILVRPILPLLYLFLIHGEMIEHFARTGEILQYFPWYTKLPLSLDPQWGVGSLISSIFNEPVAVSPMVASFYIDNELVAIDLRAVFSMREALVQLTTFFLASSVIGIVFFKRAAPE
ncbi:ABC transporter permease [candidate division NPL-UPA2 bacterium]|nr:ABC transporter permease [candidate division NPL-UPA2 bacterium]